MGGRIYGNVIASNTTLTASNKKWRAEKGEESRDEDVGNW
jgi:hypothetical protein